MRTAALLASVVASACGGAQEPPPVRFERVEMEVGSSPHVLAAELTGDGHADLAVAGEGRVLLLAGDGRGGFREMGETPAGENPTGLEAADLDGDGDLDLVAANHETDYLTLLLNDGRGGFAPAPSSPLRVDVDPHPHAVKAADLDGDGILDLVVDHRSAEGLLLLHGTGDVGFEPGPVVTMGGDPYRGMVVADLDGDGVPDLATPNPRTVGVRLGVSGGDSPEGEEGGEPGRFGALVELDARAVAPYGLVSADPNGDGRPDLAASSGEGGAGVAVYLNDGKGGFRPAPGSPYSAFEGFTAVDAGDVNGDGRDDLVVSSWNAGEVAILYGRDAFPGDDGGAASAAGMASAGDAVLGDGSEVQVQRVSVGENPWSVSTGDFDGDGRDDVAVAIQGEDRVVVLLSREP